MDVNIKEYLQLKKSTPTQTTPREYNYTYTLELNNQSDFIIRRTTTNQHRDLVFIPSDQLLYIRTKQGDTRITSKQQITRFFDYITHDDFINLVVQLNPYFHTKIIKTFSETLYDLIKNPASVQYRMIIHGLNPNDFYGLSWIGYSELDLLSTNIDNNFKFINEIIKIYKDNNKKINTKQVVTACMIRGEINYNEAIKFIQEINTSPMQYELEITPYRTR